MQTMHINRNRGVLEELIEKWLRKGILKAYCKLDYQLWSNMERGQIYAL